MGVPFVLCPRFGYFYALNVYCTNTEGIIGIKDSHFIGVRTPLSTQNLQNCIIAKTKCNKSQNQTRFFDLKSQSKRNATKIWRTHINQNKTKESSNGL